MTLIEKSLLSDPLILMPMRLVRATYRDKVFGSGGPDERGYDVGARVKGKGE